MPISNITNLIANGNRFTILSPAVFVDMTSMTVSIFQGSFRQLVAYGTSWDTSPSGQNAVRAVAGNFRSIDSPWLSPREDIICSNNRIVYGRLFSLDESKKWFVIYFLYEWYFQG